MRNPRPVAPPPPPRHFACPPPCAPNIAAFVSFVSNNEHMKQVGRWASPPTLPGIAFLHIHFELLLQSTADPPPLQTWSFADLARFLPAFLQKICAAG